MSSWVFSCKLGLSQDTCGQYEKDETARGYGRWGGCASCVHRVAANATTMVAEGNHGEEQYHRRREARLIS